jgi:outer membrane immunogenic protein
VTAALLLVLPAPSRADPWTGLYVGAFAGGAWGTGDLSTTIPDSPATYLSPSSRPAVAGSASGKERSQAFVGGVQLGANQRINQIVFGAEVDFGTFDFGGNRGARDATYPAFPPTSRYNVDAAYSAEWLATARGRLGWLASPNLLIYFTGGLALSDVKVTNWFSDYSSVVNPVATGGATRDRVKAGYALGGGFEYALTGPWSIKGEYLYIDLGKSTVDSRIQLQSFGNEFNTRVDLTANVARIGVNYSFTD